MTTYNAGHARRVLERLRMQITNHAAETPAEVVATRMRVRLIPLEESVVEQYSVNQPLESPAERERVESRLVADYAKYLRSLGHDVCRQVIEVDGQQLVTDLFDETAGELVEAKSSTDRGAIRLALGQILDYARYVESSTKAVLVPRKPSGDLCALLHSNGVDVVWQSEKGFVRQKDSCPRFNENGHRTR